jgi:hypothetical protein
MTYGNYSILALLTLLTLLIHRCPLLQYNALSKADPLLCYQCSRGWCIWIGATRWWLRVLGGGGRRWVILVIAIRSKGEGVGRARLGWRPSPPLGIAFDIIYIYTYIFLFQCQFGVTITVIELIKELNQVNHQLIRVDNSGVPKLSQVYPNPTPYFGIPHW